MKTSLFDLTWWLNVFAIAGLMALSVYVHDFKRVPWGILLLNMLIVNAGFILLGVSMNFQSDPAQWLQVTRLAVLLFLTALNGVCQYYVIRQGGSGAGMILLICAAWTVFVVVLMQCFIWFHSK